MASFNQITLIGNVGNLEVKTFTNGGKIVEASLATTKRWKDRNGDPHEGTQWHRLIIGGALADTAERYVSKGDPLMVQGEMTYRQWETREGEKRTSPEVRVQTLQLLTRKEQAAAPTARPTYAGTDHSDDLPF
jgi:single-strand DNA-binding protein